MSLHHLRINRMKLFLRTISGEKKFEEEKKEKGYYHIESTYGSFRRELTLPTDVVQSKVEATCKDGVLSINLPKADPAKAVKVKVKGYSQTGFCASLRMINWAKCLCRKNL